MLDITKNTIAAALALLLANCKETTFYRVDPAFTPEQQAEVFRAAQRWNGVSEHQLVMIDDEVDVQVIPARNAGGARGYYDDNGLIRIDLERTPDEDVFVVALHEFGHVLGLKHVANGVMDAGELFARDLTEVDMAECRRVDACHEQ